MSGAGQIPRSGHGINQCANSDGTVTYRDPCCSTMTSIHRKRKCRPLQRLTATLRERDTQRIQPLGRECDTDEAAGGVRQEVNRLWSSELRCQAKISFILAPLIVANQYHAPGS